MRSASNLSPMWAPAHRPCPPCLWLTPSRSCSLMSRDGTRERTGMRIEEHHQPAATTSDQILSEIRDYCRATQTAESTFGRLVVNDGKLVSRLRDGAKITTGTLDKVRAYLTSHRPDAPAANGSALVHKPGNGAAPVAAIAPPGFRFFD